VPISIDEFEASEDEPTNAERAVRFLLENHEKADRATEIATETNVAENSIHPVLHRLREQRLDRHREPDWAIGDVDAVRDAYFLSSTASFLDGKLGPEHCEEWLNAAEE
jgi:hypothetical protein